MELAMPSDFPAALPGQFLHIRIGDSTDPLLRRPLSIHDCRHSGKKSGQIVTILYEVVGRGTTLLAEKKPYTELDCIGPLGRGFDLEKIRSRNVYIVAGGMGVAPLFFLARTMAQDKKDRKKLIVLIGAKTKNDILRDKEFKDLGCQLHIATEDGSRGFKGRVTDLLKDILSAADKSERGLCSEAACSSSICACGPKPMLSVVSDIARRNNMAAQVSLEEFMGCGLGACLGCVMDTISGYKRICHDGPVFDASDIIWEGR